MMILILVEGEGIDMVELNLDLKVLNRGRLLLLLLFGWGCDGMGWDGMLRLKDDEADEL
jgi:hypothetical protein